MLNINQLFELNELARKDAEGYPKKRELFNSLISEKGKHFTGIVGPRGVGKTVILKQMALEVNHSFYLSLDTLGEIDLFEVVKNLCQNYGIQCLLLDEVHFQPDYDRQLKKIFDFLDLRIIFTSSVSLSLFESSYDLSRRVRLVHLFPFSYREYLYFKQDVWLSPLTIPDILTRNWTAEHLRYEYLFEEYLKGGLFPFALEEPDVLPLLGNIVQKIIKKDIPSVASLRLDELDTVEKALTFIGRSDVDGINYSSVSRNIGITKYKAESYLQLLEKAFVLNVVFPAGTNVLKEPKVLMYLPFRLLYRDSSMAVGGTREDFFAEMLKMRGIPFHYLKTSRGAKTPDFLVRTAEGDMVVEIGGKSKGREQFKGIKLEKKLILTSSSDTIGIKRPLFLLGFI